MTQCPPNERRAVERRSTMPLVSILIPAYRATWLDEAIESALAQTFSDFELLVSDDSADDTIEQSMKKWSDPRIRYFRNPNRGAPGSNRDHLISRAQGEYLKFLFDDDVLYPRSIEVLLAMVRATGCKLAFHCRDTIDDRSRLIDRLRFCVGPDGGHRPGRMLSKPLDTIARVTHFRRWFPAKADFIVVEPTRFYSDSIGIACNYIGEPSNVLIHAPTLRALSQPFQIGRHRMRYLTDMALYANFFGSGARVAGTPWVGSAFRVHAQQASNRQFPGYSAGPVEWDLFGRWAFDIGGLSYDRFKAQHDHIMAIYKTEVDRYPELRRLMELPVCLENRPFLGPDFERAQKCAYQAIDERRAHGIGGRVR